MDVHPQIELPIAIERTRPLPIRWTDDLEHLGDTSLRLGCCASLRLRYGSDAKPHCLGQLNLRHLEYVGDTGEIYDTLVHEIGCETCMESTRCDRCGTGLLCRRRSFHVLLTVPFSGH